MKNFLITIFILAGVVLSFAFMKSPKEPSEVILVRGYIWVGSGNVNTIKIYRGTAPVEVVELAKVKTKEAFDDDISKIMETVNKFTAQGYQLTSSNEFGGNASVILDFTLAK